MATMSQHSRGLFSNPPLVLPNGLTNQDFQSAVERACDTLLQLSVAVNIYKILLVLLQYLIIYLLFTVIF